MIIRVSFGVVLMASLAILAIAGKTVASNLLPLLKKSNANEKKTRLESAT
jgi:hypothetical protein